MYAKLKSVCARVCKDMNLLVRNEPYRSVATSKPPQPFKKIPGPEPSKLAEYTVDGDTVMMLQKLHDDFGDVVKIDTPRKTPLVFVFSTSAYESMYNFEGHQPERKPSGCQAYYAEKIRGKHGLVTSQGDTWKTLHSQVKLLGDWKTILSYVSVIDEVASDFVGRMSGIRDVNSFEMPENFIEEISRWALESICAVALGERINCLSGDSLMMDEAQCMILQLREMFSLIYEFDNLPYAFTPETPQLEKYCEVMDNIYGMADFFAQKAMKIRFTRNPKDGVIRHPSIYERLLLRVDQETATVMLQDLLAGGVDTVTNTVAKVLYLLACHPVEQQRLSAEIEATLPFLDSPFTVDILAKVPYLRGCVKESMRLYPATAGSTRTMHKDVVLDGFCIPKGVDVMAAHSIMGTRPDYFQEPHRFMPERWLRDCNSSFRSMRDGYTFAFRPFGVGRRACIASHLAKIEMMILIAKIVKAFKLEWKYGPLKMQHHHISHVRSSMKITMKDR